jgi:hypothetical protein
MKWRSTATKSKPLSPQGKRRPGVTADLPNGAAVAASVVVAETEVAVETAVVGVEAIEAAAVVAVVVAVV